MFSVSLHTLARKIKNSFRLKLSPERLPLESRHIAVWDPVGKWTPRYRTHAARAEANGAGMADAKYGCIASYQLASIFLEDCEVVEDWGCGFATFSRFCLSPNYLGIDGSESPAADMIVDLREYTSDADGILLRHVLEHNPTGWRQILSNAVQSFSKKMVLVIYTPFGDVTRNIRREIPRDTKVPVAISFRKEDITSCIPPDVTWFTVVGEPLAEYETMFFLQKGVERPGSYASRQEVSYHPDFEGSL